MMSSQRPTPTPHVAPMRVAIIVTHLLGVGHLTRAAALARAFVEAGHACMLISGGAPAPLLRAEGVTLVQLPPLHVHGTAFSDLLEANGAPASAATRAARIARAQQALADFSPDVVITELFPFGRRALGAEFAAIIAALQSQPAPPLLLASVRDILARPGKQAKIDAAHAVLRRDYDGVLVHADPALVPLDASWPLAADLAPRVHYTGYVDDAPPAPVAGPDHGDDAGEIIVSGGGSAAALPLLRAATGAARLDPARRWRLLVGHKIAQQTLNELTALAPANAMVERARPDFRALLSRCAASISQIGYNTALDILASGAPAVVVPFNEGGETEQGERARLFAARGLVRVVQADELSPQTLLAALEQLPQRNQASADAHAAIAVDGAARSVAIVAALLAARRTASAPDGSAAPALGRLGAPIRAALQPVRRALREVEHEVQAPIAFWWRDDDAIAPTPELEALLALARAHDAALSLAVIPAHAEAALARRLVDEPLVTVLTHGFSHENLAPPPAKKGEFSHGDAAMLAARAGGGRARIDAMFGPQARPVFVPPWNRVHAAVAPLLPGYGFCALSTFKERAAPCAAPGLLQMNTHLDPIDWHGGRDLVDPTQLAANLVDGVRRRTRVLDAAPVEPIGLLSHHLVHTPRVNAFLSELLALISDSAGARLVGVDAAMAEKPRS